MPLRYHEGDVLRLAVCLLLLGLAPVSGQETNPATFEGRRITRIDFEPAEQPLGRAELDKLLPLHAGSPLHATDVREAIQKLFITGRYRDLAVDAQPDGDGVAIRVITDFNFFVSGVSVDGEAEPPNAGQLVNAAKLPLGSAVTEVDVMAAVQNLQERLRANGLYQAQVTYRIERVPQSEQANIFYHVETGKRARFDGVKVEGQFNRKVQSIIDKTGWHRGFLFFPLPGWRDVTESRVQTGVQRVLKELQGENRLQSRVTLTDLDYHEATNRVTPSLTVEVGAATDVHTTGTKVSQGKLRQLIPVYQERTVDRNLLVEGRRNLLEYFQAQGYFDAQVELSENAPAQGQSVIEYQVTPGLRHKLTSINLSGNKYFDAATLRERMFMVPASLLRNRNGRFSQRLLDQDRNTIRDLYRANGFRDAEVTSAIDDDSGGKRGNLVVSLAVTEGAQWTVRKLEITGAEADDLQYLTSIVQSGMGQPFSDANIAADRDAILSYYYNNGYPDAMFDWMQTETGEANRVDLRFEIRAGERQYVRSVLVTGLAVTDRELVRSRILLADGDSVSQSKIGESQQKLYDLGIFSKVQAAVQNPDGEENNKYVIFHMDEARKYSINFGLGAELGRIGGGTILLSAPAGAPGFSPRASVGISRINFLGLGHTISVQTLASTIRQRALFNYVAPQFKGRDSLALTFSALFDNSRDVRTFSALRLEGSVQLSDRLSRANTVQYRYVFRRVDLTRVNLDPVLVPIFSQPNLTGLVGFSFIQDKRDDPLNTHRGIYNTVDLGVAGGPLGSQTDFTRLLLRNSTYHRISKDIVLARSAQFGWIQRFGGLAQIPLAERFYAGGASSLRAFPDNQAGPRDLTTGFPLGGSALLIHSTELRFPLIGDNLGGVFFHDMGNVFSNVSNLSFRVVQKNDQDFDYMVHAVGFGVRYRTPVGPVRIDLSVSPNSPHFIGYAGTREQLYQQGLSDPVRQRINVFQFHFSLGQTF